jgi:hypothetical protein
VRNQYQCYRISQYSSIHCVNYRKQSENTRFRWTRISISYCRDSSCADSAAYLVQAYKGDVMTAAYQFSFDFCDRTILADEAVVDQGLYIGLRSRSRSARKAPAPADAGALIFATSIAIFVRRTSRPPARDVARIFSNATRRSSRSSIAATVASAIGHASVEFALEIAERVGRFSVVSGRPPSLNSGQSLSRDSATVCDGPSTSSSAVLRLPRILTRISLAIRSSEFISFEPQSPPCGIRINHIIHNNIYKHVCDHNNKCKPFVATMLHMYLYSDNSQ